MHHALDTLAAAAGDDILWQLCHPEARITRYEDADGGVGWSVAWDGLHLDTRDTYADARLLAENYGMCLRLGILSPGAELLSTDREAPGRAS